MNLHRSGKLPEWETVTGELTGAQKVAARTKGIVTPGNGVSLTGAALVTGGLLDVRKGHKKRALAKVVVGRLAGLLALPHIANTILTAIAKKRGTEIHPTAEGKQATGYQWGALAAYGVGRIISDYNETAGRVFERTGDMLSGVSLFLGAVAIKDYAQDAFAEVPVIEAEQLILEVK